LEAKPRHFVSHAKSLEQSIRRRGHGQDPVQILAGEDDDRASIADFAKRLRELGFSKEQIDGWHRKAWETAKQLAPEYLAHIKFFERTPSSNVNA